MDPRDEARHEPDPDVELWNESYYLDWFAEDLSVGGYVRIGFYPNLNRVWYWACLVGERRPLVTVIDHDVAMPARGDSLEIRHEGLWADHSVVTPREHMSVDLESFALALEDPAAVYGEARGERVPFGLQLDFHTDRLAYEWPPVTPRYEIPCRVEGEVLVGEERIVVDGWGQRDHSWGAARDWWGVKWCWSAGRLEDGTRFHTAGGFFGEESDWGVAYELKPGGELVEGDEVRVGVTEGRGRLPTSGTLGFCDLELTVTPVAFSPVGLVHPRDGRLDRFPRAMAHFDSADGRRGGGWIEWNQPPTAPV